MDILKTFGEVDWRESVEHSLDRAPKNTEFDVVALLNWVYAFAGLVAVGFIVYGAISYLTAQGEPGKIKQASQTIAYAIVGLLIVLIATAVTYFISNGVAQ